MTHDWLSPGDEVAVTPEISGVIEEVIWCRGMEWPVYLIEYWDKGCLFERRFHAVDVVAKR